MTNVADLVLHKGMFFAYSDLNRKYGVGQVVLRATEQEREKFRTLKSDDLATTKLRPDVFEAYATSGTWQEQSYREQNRKLVLDFEKNVLKVRSIYEENWLGN